MMRSLRQNRSARAAVPFALAVVFLFFPWRVSGVLAEALGLPFLLAYTVLYPGAALTRWLGVRPGDRAEAAALWILHGLFVLLACAFVWAVLSLSPTAFSVLLAAVITALALFAPAPDDTRVVPGGARDERGLRTLAIALAVLAVFICGAVYVAGAPLGFGADTYDYLAWTNEVAATGDPFPHTAFYKDPGMNGADLRKGLLHAVYGYYVFSLGIDAIRLFAALSAWLLLGAVLAVYAAARRLFEDRVVAIASAILFLLCFDGGPGHILIRTWSYPGRFGIVALLAFTAQAVSFMRRPSPRGLALSALYAFTAAAIHIQFVVLVALVSGVVLLWKTCSPRPAWRDHAGGALQLGVAAFLGMLPWAVFRFVTAYQTNELHAQVQGVVYVFRNLFMLDPARVWQTTGFLALAALVAVVPAWSLRRARPEVGFLCAAVVSVLLIQYNPLVLPVFYDVISYLVHRLDRVAPWYMLAAFVAVSAARGGAGMTRRGFAGASAVLTLVAVIGGLLSLPGRGAITPAALAREHEYSYRRWERGLADLTSEIPAGSVIASDPVTSYTIPALTPHYVLCTLDQHAPPNDRLARVRMTAARDITGPFTPADVRAALADTFAVTHVVINHNVPMGMTLDYFAMDPYMARMSGAELDRLPEAFVRTKLRDSLVVYARTDAPAPRTKSAAARLLVAEPPRGATAIGKNAGEATLEAARISPPRARAGDDLVVDLYWSRTGHRPPATYVVFVRLDRAGLALPAGGKPFPKLARKLREFLDGRLYRARFDHMPSQGFFSPDLWPEGAIVRDVTSIRVPADLGPGEYTVRAKMLAVAHVPNHRLHDFFYDDDVYDGVEIGTIEIVR